METSSSLESDISRHSDADDPNGDSEGVWTEKIEQAFQEALTIYPPCGRRKHILQEEGGGKMFGRNEMIAKYIKDRTGHHRTRKQVSSHIQVHARRRAKTSTASNSSLGNGNGGCPSTSPTSTLMGDCGARPQSTGHLELKPGRGYTFDTWEDRPIVTPKIRLVEFSAFIERRFPPTNHLDHQAAPVHQQPPTHPLSSHYGNQPAPRDCIVGSQHSPVPVAIGGQSQMNANGTLLSPALANSNRQHHLYPSQQAQHYFYPNQNGATATRNTYTSAGSNNLHHHQSVTTTSSSSSSTSSNSPSSSRHCYIKIDHTQPSNNSQTNKLEHIDIREIADYFPEINGPNGLFQRGPKDSFFLVKFWADLTSDHDYNIDDQNSFFGFSSRFEMADPHYKDITCSSQAYSYGAPVVERVEKIYGKFNSTNGRYSYDINRSEMCEFMIQFIRKLRQLPRTSQMNSVLENFTVLQVVTCESTAEILLCLAYVFEVASPEQTNEPQYHVYKLTGN